MDTNVSMTAVENSIHEFETVLDTLITDTRGQQQDVPSHNHDKHSIDDDSTIQEIESAITEIRKLITDLRVDYMCEILKKQK